MEQNKSYIVINGISHEFSIERLGLINKIRNAVAFGYCKTDATQMLKSMGLNDEAIETLLNNKKSKNDETK